MSRGRGVKNKEGGEGVRFYNNGESMCTRLEGAWEKRGWGGWGGGAGDRVSEDRESMYKCLEGAPEKRGFWGAGQRGLFQ